MIPLPLFAGMDNEYIAIVEDEDIDQLFAPLQVDESQLCFDLFDYDGEASDLEDDMLDREFWARGGW